MAIDFGSMLSTEQKRELLNNRINQFAAEAYQYSLNKKTAEELGSDDQVESISKSIDILEAAIRVHLEELATLPKPTE